MTMYFVLVWVWGIGKGAPETWISTSSSICNRRDQRFSIAWKGDRSNDPSYGFATTAATSFELFPLIRMVDRASSTLRSSRSFLPVAIGPVVASS